MDLGIALEMLLLKDNTNREQLSLSFRLRGAWLVSGTPEERHKNYQLLKELYNYRSQVAHSGLLESGNAQKIEKVRNQFPEYQALAEKISRRLLNNPQVNWEDLVVGGVSGEAGVAKEADDDPKSSNQDPGGREGEQQREVEANG
jgi:hypothetical protein